MEKQGKVTPAEPGRRTESARQQHDSSNRHVILPNPHLYQHKSRGNESGVGPKWSLASNINGGDLPWRAKASTKNNEPRVQSGIAGKNSADAQRRGVRDSRSARTPKPTQADLATFDVKMSDFPQLDAGPAQGHKENWRPNVTVERCQLPSKSISPWVDVRQQTTMRGSTTVPDPRQTDGPTLASTTAKQVGTSWAYVASQPPKKNFQKEKTVVPTEETATQQPQEETAAGRKKQKKKKKKVKEADDCTEDETEDSAVQQEPPKFEDEEEFPGLAPSQTLCDRLTSSRNTINKYVENQQDEMTAIRRKNATKTPPAESAKKGQKAEKTSGKKSKAPVQLDIGNMLSVLENKQQSQKVKQTVISVGGGLPVVHKQPTVQKKTPWQQDKIAHNPLDSTSPLVKKGKQREVPKVKKPTALKKVILKEREERKQRRLLEERGLLPENESTVVTDTAEEERCNANLTDEDVGAVSGSDEQQENEMARGGDGESDRVRADEQHSNQQDVSINAPDQLKIHSRKFREYCSQMLSKDVDQCVTSLLKELVRFQDRLYQKDPMKAHMKRRMVMGLREVLKHLKLRKVKCVIISPNCERVQAKGGLDEALHTIIDTCREQEVPFVFALSRKALGRCVNKMVPVSLVGIFNYDGAQDYYHQMIELSSEARKAYEEMLASVERAVRAERGDANFSEQHSAAKLIETEQSEPEPESEEPGYYQLWRKLLEKESNYKSLNFDAWPSECNNENEKS
ncbi:selenocysteine insertion sequence-binding protein 2-like isoform X1 [Phyllopteryx taeniolatus]|uniref:selenocysteine insertion sequence-binding protein 2-like isoform X1 n=1 Tax=Phyllopteryx taeniolatus TaxID=161469 RepID=UPI002AD31BA3|nr:selenocysteine insertion sequence-binding protein 2-like isoform X1 [Phyllopteryx taeniolatus]